MRITHPGSLVALLLLMMTMTPLARAELPGLPASPMPERTPGIESLLGIVPGTRHPEPHQLVALYRALEQRSDRVVTETIGLSTGGNEHLLVYFARPDRLAELDRIRAGRIEASRAGDGPPVIWLGYSVHGNEASGASAAAVLAWYLAFSDDPQVHRWLDELVIVMEPVINPDGLDRFAHWANMHRGRNPSPDENDREHNEAWPNGRTSYYWFDLNRDWLPLTHPVSRQRIAHYRQWRPHVVTDAHEMGHRSSYFFQPGIPERNNPATPARVYELTRRIAEYHGEILDAAGEPYYSRESFDDYYLGKGSTYPDLTGGIGILFEQGSARGHVMDTPYGKRSFADAIANQVRTSISTLNAGADLKAELIAHQADFFGEARERAGRGGWLLGDDGDPARARRLLETLITHGIEVRAVSAEIEIGDRTFGPGSAWAIPASQDQYRFIEAIFATPTDLPMETFYDVSAWPLQHAFDLPLSRVGRLPGLGDALDADSLTRPEVATPDPDATAWAVDWRQHNAPAVLAALLARGYRVQAAEDTLRLSGLAGDIVLAPGSFFVHAGIQPDDLPPAGEVLAELATRHAVRIEAITSGHARGDGIDLGSPSAPVLEAPRPLLLAGDGVSSYAAGATWRWFDLALNQPVTRVAPGDLPGSLEDYTHIIVPPGRYSGVLEADRQRLVDYLRAGGQLIAFGSAAEWVESLELDWSFGEEESGKEAEEEETPKARRYADHELDFARRLIGGSALAIELDTSHPLAWGYPRERVTGFRQGAHVLKTSDNPYATPGRYPETPLVAGYLSDSVAKKLAGTPAIAGDRFGSGLVVRIAEEPLFRGYWAATERLMANALFYGQLIDSTTLPD